MKTKLMILLLSLGTTGVFAQSNDKTITTDNNGCKTFPHMPRGAVAVFPKSPYTPLEDPSCPPCYEYRSKYGYKVMECPYVMFPPEHANKELSTDEAVRAPYNSGSLDAGVKAENKADLLEARSENVYTGNYPAVCLRSPDMPRGAKMVFPKTAYTPIEDPSCPPCYEYRSKYGYMVMECPFLRFAPEHKNDK